MAAPQIVTQLTTASPVTIASVIDITEQKPNQAAQRDLKSFLDRFDAITRASAEAFFNYVKQLYDLALDAKTTLSTADFKTFIEQTGYKKSQFYNIIKVGEDKTGIFGKLAIAGMLPKNRTAILPSWMWTIPS
jgi:hypothetical protein